MDSLEGLISIDSYRLLNLFQCMKFSIGFLKWYIFLHCIERSRKDPFYSWKLDSLSSEHLNFFLFGILPLMNYLLTLHWEKSKNERFFTIILEIIIFFSNRFEYSLWIMFIIIQTDIVDYKSTILSSLFILQHCNSLVLSLKFFKSINHFKLAI